MSSKIAVLPDEIAARIAAGEVIERPASAVKELVENAIDAGATRITIDIAEAGRRLIRVTDDGEGMTAEDARRAFLRHATSKIRTDADLFRVRTLGFRGEALPSIGAVSRVRLVTTTADASCATELYVEGGAIKDHREAAAAPGTMVEVADLFYNTPARKKFLKSPGTEFSHICQVVQREALGFPGIQFRLVHNGVAVLEYPAVRSQRARIQQVYGLKYVDTAVEVTVEDEDLRVDGLCSRPLDSGAARSPQEMLINGRWVKSPSLSHAVYEAYGTYLTKGSHPRFVLHLSIDPRVVDMNVHPAKREVRFSNQEQLHTQVLTWVRRAIGEKGSTPVSVRMPDIRSLGAGPPSATENAAFCFNQAGTPGSASAVDRSESLHAAEAVPPYDAVSSWEVRPLGQIADRYLLAQVGKELHIVDQHTAHERVLFERLSRQRERGALASQQSLIPHRVELSASAAMVLRMHLSDLADLGLEVEDFGGGTFLLRSMPALLTTTGHSDPAALLQGMVEDWEGDTSTRLLTERYHASLATMACHSAVRSGRRMELPEVRELLQNWCEVGLPSTCPHGRRIAMRLTIEELDRIFGRQGWT
jgi:DNA mismatch repair protein MutL